MSESPYSINPAEIGVTAKAQITNIPADKG
jgi:hypothetical protein